MTEEMKQTEVIKNYLWRSTTAALIAGLIMIGLISKYSGNISTSSAWNAFGCGVLIAGASLSSGGFLGFLFGIPSISQTPNARFRYNDNLVQISDWLTKIIVGVGLTQLYEIPRFVKKIGFQLSTNFGGNQWGTNVSVAIISYFFVIGALMIYFWTKTDYSTVMRNLDTTLNDLLNQTIEKLTRETKEKEQAQDEKKEMAEQIVQKDSVDRISASSVASDKYSISELQENLPDLDLKNKIEILKELVTKVYKSKPIMVPDDPQKNRWSGKSESNGRKIAATVTKNAWQNLFDVNIVLTDLKNEAINDPAVLFLHDSYRLPEDAVYLVPEPSKKIMEISLLAYEAFTVGALFPDGTELELDLNEQKGYPPDFYWK